MEREKERKRERGSSRRRDSLDTGKKKCKIEARERKTKPTAA